MADLNSSFYQANVSEARLLDLSNWTTSNITSLHYTFSAFRVHDLTIKNWNLSSYLMLESAFSTTMTRLELGAWKNASTAIPNPSAYGLNTIFWVYPKVVVLNSEFKFYPNDGFIYSPPSNDTYSGRWQAVGAGTEEKPLGQSYSISELRALYAGGANNGPDETYVWERTKVTVKATKSWKDNNNQDNSRPASVTVELLANSAPTGVLLQLSASNSWTGSFEPQNKVDDAGAIITYTVKEQDLDPNYTVAITGDAANGYTLTNTYEAPSVVPTPAIVPTYPTIEVPLSVKKVLRNGSLKAGEFTFELRDSKGQVLAEAKNAANGDVVFPNRTFSRAVSNYIYTIREVPGKNENITYDKTVYTVKVTTTPQNGVLVAKLALEKDGVPYAGDITFTNQRKPVKTGDDQFRDIALLLGASLLVLGGAQVLRKRKDAGK